MPESTQHHQERFATLRELLQRTPSEELWDKLTELLDQWQDPDVLREVVVPYAQEHLASWDDQLRISTKRWRQRAYESLHGTAPDNALLLLCRSLSCIEEEEKDRELDLICSHHFGQHTCLYFHLSNFSPGDLQRIVSSPHTTQITNLSLLWGAISDAQLPTIAAAPWRLRSLRLSGNGLSDTAVATMLRQPSMKGLKHLDLSKVTKIAEYTMEAIAESELALETLNLDSCASFRMEALQRLVRSKAFQTIETLVLKSTSVNDYDMDEPELGRQLAASPHVPPLKSLDLTFCNFHDQDAIDLASWQGLEQLENIALTNHNIDDAGIDALVNSPYLRQLKGLDFSWAQQLSDEGFARLCQAPWLEQLESIALWSCGIDPRRAAIIAKSPYLQHLKELKLWSNPLSAEGLAAMLTTNKFAQLQFLDLSGCDLRDQGIQHLLASSWPQLRHLKLQRNHITSPSIHQLLSSHHFPQLQELFLCGNDLSELPVEDTFSYPLMLGLETLYLTNTDLTSEHIKMLCRTLQENQHLQRLSLGNNSKIGDQGLQMLLEAPFFPRCKEVFLDDCGISDKGAQMLLDMASQIEGMEILIADNSITNEALIQELQQRLVTVL